MKLQHLTWTQVEKYFTNSDLVIIPVGSCENHGTHLPLGTDALIPDKIAELVEEQRNVLCAPTIAYGNCEYFSQFPGTISLGSKLLYDLVLAVAEGLYNAGARRFVFINGHGGNMAPIEEVCYSMSKKKCLSVVFNWWTMVGDFNPQWLGGHGGGQETAAMMYINPGFVDKNRYEDKDIRDVTENIKSTSLKVAEYKGVKVVIPREVVNICRNGWYGPDDLESANIEWGEAMLTQTADYICDFIDEFILAELV